MISATAQNWSERYTLGSVFVGSFESLQKRVMECPPSLDYDTEALALLEIGPGTGDLWIDFSFEVRPLYSLTSEIRAQR